MLGKFGGFGGGLGKAAQVANQVQQYEGYIESAAGLASSMLETHPDPTDRWSAYSGQMVDQGQKLYKARQAIADAQNCYDAAYDDLSAQVADGSLKSRKAKKPLKEIKKGTKETGKLLDAVLNQARNNANAYGEALGGETSGLDVGGFLSGQAAYCANAAGPLAAWCGTYNTNAIGQLIGSTTATRAASADTAATSGGMTGINRLAALAGLGGLSRTGLPEMAGRFGGASTGAPSQASLMEIGSASQDFISAASALPALRGPQRSLEEKVKSLAKR